MPELKTKDIVITAILCIALLEAIAIFKGLDGAYFGLVIAAVSGLAGYEIKELSIKPNQ